MPPRGAPVTRPPAVRVVVVTGDRRKVAAGMATTATMVPLSEGCGRVVFGGGEAMYS